MPGSTKPRICLVGPMIGRNPGSVTTQGERLADLLGDAGYSVIAVSHLPNRYLRPLDMARVLLWERHRFDVAILQVFSGPSFIVEDFTSTLLRGIGRPIIMVLRGGGMPVFASEHPVWTKRVLGRGDALVTPSPFLARAIVPLGCHAQVIPNVVQLDRYAFRVRTVLQPRLFWMRSYHAIYNPALAVRALASVKRTHPNATLVMAGPDRGEEKSTRALAADLGLSDSVRFAGFLDPERKREEFDTSDIYLNTNRVDNMPVSVLEACASGVPVIATRVGGVPDLLAHGENALLVRSDDPDQIAEAVTTLLGDPALAQRLSVNGRALAERSAATTVMNEWYDLIARIAAGGARGAA
jgi:glycosyltransferase involved in cell wall biosynthesis